MNLGNVELRSQITKEQPTNHQETMKILTLQTSKYKEHTPRIK